MTKIQEVGWILRKLISTQFPALFSQDERSNTNYSRSDCPKVICLYLRIKAFPLELKNGKSQLNLLHNQNNGIFSVKYKI